MTAFSGVSHSSLCTTISHRALSAAVELDELTELAQFSGLPNRLRQYSKVAESLGESIGRATAISEELQNTLSQSLNSCAQAAAVLEKEIKALGSQQPSEPPVNPRLLSEFELWAALATQAFELLQQIVETPSASDQDVILNRSTTEQVLQGVNRAANSAAELSSHLLDADDDQPPGYGDSAPEYPNDVKDPSLFAAAQTSANETPASPSTAGPSQPKQSRGGLASLSEAFKAMTSSLRYKPEPLVVALCEASARGNVQNIASLISSGANVNGRDEAGKTPIVRAIENHQLEIVKELLNKGASREVCDTAKKLPPLFWAAEVGDIKIATLLLQRGCSPREGSVWGTPYFTDVVTKAPLEMVQLLLAYGADVNAKDVSGRKIIFHAYSKGSFELLKLLHSRGADVNSRDITGSPLVSMAMQDGRIDVLEYLLTYGADPNTRSITGTPLLVEAVQKGRLDVMKMLLERGANPNVSDVTGNPIIMVVIKSTKFNPTEKAELVRLLLSRGANPNVKDPWSFSAISYVLDKGVTELVPLFIAGGADPNQTIANGDTLLLHAIDKRQQELVTQLLRHGANPNGADKKGRTPLLQALRKRDFATAKLLVQHGANPNMKGMVTPLSFAKALDDEDTVKLLRTYGAIPEPDDHTSTPRPARGSGGPSVSAQTDHPMTEAPPPDYDAALKQ